MESEEIIKKYAYYLDTINNFGRVSFTDKTVRKLHLKRGNVLRAYDEIKELGFKGSIQGYLCYIATSYIFYLMELIDPNYSELPDKKFEDILKRLCDAHLNTTFCVVLFCTYQRDMFDTFMTMKLSSNRRVKSMLDYFSSRQTISVDYES